MTVLAATAEPTRLHLSESPYGTSPRARAAAAGALELISRYPDPSRAAVVGAVATLWNLAEDEIAVANGSDELVLLASLTVGDPDRPGLATAGTFPGYRICLETVRRGCREVPLTGGRMDVAAFAEALPQTGVGFVCNPHNPTGGVLSRSEMDLLVAAARDSGVPIVFDEAYLEFAPTGTPQVRDYLDSGAPVVALRTLSKAYGLAALRIGYAVGPAAVLAGLRASQGTMPFSANVPGQAAAVAALADQDFLESVRAENAIRRNDFCVALRRHGRRYLPSVTNFVAVQVSDSADAEARLASEHGILVRDAGRFGFPGYVRISMGEPDQLDRVLAALDEIDPVLAAGDVRAADLATYLVVINTEGQHSVWPADRPLPAGWNDTGFRGSESECLDRIESVWTDLRPRSVRELLAAGRSARTGSERILKAR